MRKLIARLIAGKDIENIILKNQELKVIVANQERDIEELKSCNINSSASYSKLCKDYQALKHKLQQKEIDFAGLEMDLEQMTKARDTLIQKNQRLGGKYTALQKRIRKQEKE